MSFTCPTPRKGLILHSGAIGDCLLTLPLAAFMKRACGLTQVHFMGRPEAVGFYPGRSCVDFVRPMESVPLHRLFEPQATFTLDDPDRLITAFAGYEQIVSFLGAGHSEFEQNLLLTVHCSHSAEVTMLPMAPPHEKQEPISQFYVRSFAEQIGIEAGEVDVAAVWLTPTPEDQLAGRDWLATAGGNAVLLTHLRKRSLANKMFPNGFVFLLPQIVCVSCSYQIPFKKAHTRVTFYKDLSNLN